MRRVNAICCGLAVAAIMVCDTIPAASQGRGFFDTFFRRLFGPPPPTTSITRQQRPNDSSRTAITVTPRHRAAVSGRIPYCVRLCDGRYFPLPRLSESKTSPKSLCQALCPGSATSIYWASRIGHPPIAKNVRYSRLNTALKFRQELVAGCTCNGRDAFGTAVVSIYADTTLRRGDVVVTENGLSVFVGSDATKHAPSEFTPIENYTDAPSEQQKELQAIRVALSSESNRQGLTFNARVKLGFKAFESQLIPHYPSELRQ